MGLPSRGEPAAVLPRVELWEVEPCRGETGPRLLPSRIALPRLDPNETRIADGEALDSLGVMKGERGEAPMEDESERLCTASLAGGSASTAGAL